MAYIRTYHTVLPLLPDADVDVARWLMRESFELKAAGDCLTLIDYAESTVSPDDIPPKAAKQLGRPITDYQWFGFTGKATAVTPSA